MTNTRFFGLKINPVAIRSLVDCIIPSRINERIKCVISNHNLHSLYLCLKNKELATWINDQDTTHADGMSIVYLGKLFGAKLNRDNRITYVDLLPVLFNMAQKCNYKIYYLGTTQQRLSAGLLKIRAQYPNLNITGHDGFELEGIIEKINSFEPNVLLVGMGMPKQEYWIKENIDKLKPMVIMPCGAAIDYIAGVTKTPPRWAGRIGLEWAFRLMYDPKRLWKRYMLEPLYILMRLILWKWWK
jgi:N-acetylglucosaminyldiphosphoundecaprenol N-acetyl-beta-D-mannosaminyltransferase